MTPHISRVSTTLATTIAMSAFAVFATGCDRNELTPLPSVAGQSGSTPTKTQPSQDSQMPLDNNNPPTDEPITPTVAAYSIAQVATHNTAANCWIVLDGKVYNVTEWISKHPGGARAITSRCGTDASRAFANVGHSSSADDIRATYFIGNLAQ